MIRVGFINLNVHLVRDKRILLKLCLAASVVLFSLGRLFSQNLHVTQAGVIESGYGVTPNLTGASSVFVSGNYAYVVGTGDVLEILDITLPGVPIHKGSLANGVGGANILRPQAVFVSGKYAYITSYGGNALEIVDVSDPAAPVHKGSISDGGGAAPFLNQAWGVYVLGNYAYVASSASRALEIIDVSNPSSPVHKGSLLDGGGSAPYLGNPFSVYVSGPYAYVSGDKAFEIVDISNPALPVHVGSLLDGKGSAPYLNQSYSISIAGDLAYVPSLDGALNIIDISNPANPSLKGVLKDGGTSPPYLYAPFSVKVSGQYAFISNIGSTVFSPSYTATGVFEIVDISNPASPVHKAALIDPLFKISRSVFVANNVAYSTSRPNDCLNIIDVTNPASPRIINSPKSGSGGALINGAQSVYVSGEYAYVASASSDALEILDVSNPSLPKHKGILMNGTGGAQLDNPVSVFVSGGYAYIASNNSGVLEVVDVSNPALPAHKGSVSLLLPPPVNSTANTAYYPTSVYVSGAYVYVVSESANALLLISLYDPASPTITSIITDGVNGAMLKNPSSVYVSGNYAYVASYGSNALEIIDVSQPGAPIHKSSLVNGSGGALLSKPSSVFVSGNYAYVVSDGSNALEVVDITNPSIPVHAGSLVDGGGSAPFLDTPSSICVSGKYAYITSLGSQALEVVDVSNPITPMHQGSLANGTSGALLDGPTSVFISGNYGYITNGNLYQDVDIFYLYGPSITDFAPITGQVGTSITITGQNFNTFVTASINGVAAPVTAVTATTITVTIPANASIGKIDLSYSGQNVSSAANFVIAPSAATASNVGATSLTANWSDVGAAGYFLDLSTDGFKTFVAGYNNLSVGNNHAYIITGLQPASSYQYRVRSTDGAVISGNSNSIRCQTISPTPKASAATAITETSFTANWSSVKGATGYYFDVSSDSSFTRFFLVGYNNLIVPGAQDTTQYVTGLSPYTHYYYRVRSYDSAGVSVSSATIPVFTPDNNAPQIIPAAANPATITFGDSPLFNVSMKDNVRIDTARFYYKGIAHKSFNSLLLKSTDGNYSVTVQSSWLDSLGLEYYFLAKDEAGNKTVSPTGYSQVVYPSITLPPLPSGDSQSDYRIVAFPYRLSAENLAAFFLAVPLNDETKVAIWWWDPTLKNGSGGYSKLSSGSTATTFDPGKGYWVLLRNPVTPQLTNVTAPSYNRSNLYSMILKPGWNEIGNPYPVDISWDDVIAFNARTNPGALFSPLNVFDGSGFKQATGHTSFKAFEGGFVKNTGSSDIVIQIPFPGQQDIGARLSAMRVEQEQNNAWAVSLHISQLEFRNELGGFGMHPQAQSGPDRFDNFNPPAPLSMPEVNFTNQDYPGVTFSNDIVPSQNTYHWLFTPNGNYGERTELTWSANRGNSADKPLYLFDEELIQVIDMKEVSKYSFTLTEKSRFAIYYGVNTFNSIAAEDIKIGSPYPNPIITEASTSINISLPDQQGDYQVTCQFYTAQGNSAGSFSKTLSAGINTMTFNLSDYKVSPGIILYKISISSEKSSKVFSGKIVKL